MRIKYSRPRCPFRYRSELVDWATKYFKDKKSKFQKMKIKQLYAIWYAEERRRREGK